MNLANPTDLLKSNIKDTIFYAPREKKQITHRKKMIGMTADFSSEMVEARTQ